MVPTRASASSNTPSHSKSTMRSPLSVTQFTVSESPSSTTSRVPRRHFLPGFTSTSHLKEEMRFNKSTSTFPPCSVCAYSLAGNTLVLFITNTSPGRRYCFMSRKILCSTLSSTLLYTSMREESRGSTGVWAMSSSGRS